MQDLNDMMYFAEVVTQGSFAAAGRTLGIPKSRLSRRVARLEDELGVRLLQRTTRKLSLTMAGELYYRHCLAMCEQAQAASAAVAQVQVEPRGIIRVACPVTVAQTMVGPLLPDFQQLHPLVQVHMAVSNRVVDVVEEGVDIALRVRVSLAESGSLVVKHLGRSQVLLVASPGQLERQGVPSQPSDLTLLDSVAMSVSDERAIWTLFGPNGAQYRLTHRPRLVADDMLTLKYAILGGVGAGLLPDYMCVDEIAQGRLVQPLPQWSTAPGIVHAVFSSRRGMVPAVRAFLDFLGERLMSSGQPS
ncbi:LysR family transcriptional regulator [Allopusillimonas soli]|uniref:LysR family transcriptional regulator n=1 Tax=Allopusillimonas soli TaxID=659016 RepID=A0A853FE30_9BURK|nr:LysR family transcriptional regulator [Allopusillimonas soli]NYT37080.1 LysR family transcriptional regulator [Allopusillimonas soli]TEA75515.1 LysR family transcriptional regulator [Allopusillimonas soli]